MLTSQRKQHILEQLAADGQVLSKDLSARFAVSEDTIRRDLRELAAEGHLQRVHGGALPSSTAVATFTERKSLRTRAREGVALRGAQLISAGQVVIIDGGTTTSELIGYLPHDLQITVVTHSPSIALGLIYIPVYYYGFRFIIQRMRVETPGRETEEEDATPQVEAAERIKVIISGLGGAENIEDVDC